MAENEDVSDREKTLLGGSAQNSAEAIEAAEARSWESTIKCDSRLLPWTLVALVVFFAAVIRIRMLGTPLERDEGEYAYAGQLMLQGIPPYELAFNMKFPGTYGAYALIMALFGQTIAGIHTGFIFVNAASIVLLYLLGKRLFGSAAGVASSAAYALLSIGKSVMGTQAHATHFVVLAALGGTLLLLRAINSGRFWTLFASGFLYSVSVLMKQQAVLFVAFGAFYLLICHLWSVRRVSWISILRKLAVFLGGTSLPLFLTGFVLWRAGVFSKFWFWTFTYAREYVLEQSLYSGIDAFELNFPRAVGWNFLVWIVALAGFVVIWSKNQNRAVAVFISTFLVFSFLAVCPGLYFRRHYFVLMLPAIALLAGSTVSSARAIWPRHWWPAYVVFGTALVVSVVLQQRFLFRMSPVDVSRMMYGPSPFPEAIEIADYIRTHSAKASRIAVLGSEPEIPFYANRHSATGQIYMYGMMESQPYALTMQNEMIRDVEAARPDYVVFIAGGHSWERRDNSPTRIFEWWDAYCARHYEIVGIAAIDPKFPPDICWGDVGSHKVHSPNVVRVYRRTDFERSR